MQAPSENALRFREVVRECETLLPRERWPEIDSYIYSRFTRGGSDWELLSLAREFREKLRNEKGNKKTVTGSKTSGCRSRSRSKRRTDGNEIKAGKK